MEDRLNEEHWLARAILFPGQWICDRFNIENDDSRMLLRLYLNLAIYAKVFGTIAYIYATG